MYSVWNINLSYPAWRHSWITVSCVTFQFSLISLLINEIFYGNHYVDTLSRYRLAYVIGFVVIQIVITIIGKKCQNTHFFTRFQHCVEVFEEMVGNWRVWVTWLKSAFLVSPDRLHFIWKHYTHKEIFIFSYHPSFLSSFSMLNSHRNLSYPPLQTDHTRRNIDCTKVTFGYGVHVHGDIAFRNI